MQKPFYCITLLSTLFYTSIITPAFAIPMLQKAAPVVGKILVKSSVPAVKKAAASAVAAKILGKAAVVGATAGLAAGAVRELTETSSTNSQEKTSSQPNAEISPQPSRQPDEVPHPEKDIYDEKEKNIQKIVGKQTGKYKDTSVELLAVPTDPEKKEKDPRDGLYKNFALMGALIKSNPQLHIDKNQTNFFDLPGSKVAVDDIPVVSGAGGSYKNYAMISNVEIPEYGNATLFIEYHKAPTAIAPEQGQQKPVVYPPHKPGKLVRVKNVQTDGAETSDLLLCIPDELLEEIEKFKECQPEKLVQTLVMAAAAGPVLHAAMNVAGFNNNSSNNDKASDTKMQALGLLFRGAALAAGGSTAMVTIGEGVGIVFGGTVTSIALPIVIGGTVIYGVVKLGIFIKKKQDLNKDLRAALDDKARTPRHICGWSPGCGKMEQPQKPQPGCVPGKLPDTKPTGFGDPNAKNQPTHTHGDPAPKPEKQKPGCGDIKPQSLDELVLKKFNEANVKWALGKLLYDFDFNTRQKQLDHITDGHIEGGKDVYKDPLNPKTLFNNEGEVFKILDEGIRKGQTKIEGNNVIYEHDFGYSIGKTVTGKPLSIVRIVIRLDKTGKGDLITMYPVEVKNAP